MQIIFRSINHRQSNHQKRKILRQVVILLLILFQLSFHRGNGFVSVDYLKFIEGRMNGYFAAKLRILRTRGDVHSMHINGIWCRSSTIIRTVLNSAVQKLTLATNFRRLRLNCHTLDHVYCDITFCMSRPMRAFLKHCLSPNMSN